MRTGKIGMFIGITVFALYGFAISSWAAETSVSPHQLTSADKKIVDAIGRMSGEKTEKILRLYDTGKGWGDVSENLGLEMEDVLKEVDRFEKSEQTRDK